MAAAPLRGPRSGGVCGSVAMLFVGYGLGGGMGGRRWGRGAFLIRAPAALAAVVVVLLSVVLLLLT